MTKSARSISKNDRPRASDAQDGEWSQQQVMQMDDRFRQALMQERRPLPPSSQPLPRADRS